MPSSSKPPADRMVAVYVSAQPSAGRALTAAAAALGTRLAQAGLGIVCGGTRTGPLGALIAATSDSGGYSVGVVTRTMPTDGSVSPHLSDTVVVPILSTRKVTMRARSRQTLVMPGGVGTLDELFTDLAVSRYERRDRSTLLWSIDGLFDGLVSSMQHLQQSGLIGDAPVVDVVIGGTDRLDDVVSRLLAGARN